jgi:uncharacterized delta-60 repeat protein
MAGKFYDSVSGLQVVAVCRYLSSGTLDLSFGGSGTGKVTVQLNTGTTDGVSGIALQSDGKIVICGYQVFPFSLGPPSIPATSNIFVLRLTTSGILDTGVGGFNLGSVGGAAPGYLYTTPAEFTSVFSPSLNSTNCSAEAIAMQTIGATEYIVVGGAASMYQPPASSATAVAYYALARYTLLGVLDTTFNLSGLVVQSFLPLRDHFGIDLYVDSTQILLAGVKYYTPPVNVTTRMTVVKFNGGGILDSTWGTNGNGLTDIPNFFINSQDSANAIRVQTNGYIILGGTSTNNDLPYQQRCFVLARLLPTGGLDASYGSGGVVITDLSPAYNLYANAMVIQPDDKIVLGGTWDILGTSPASFALARYDAAGILAGTLDTTFGLAGTGLILEDLLPNPGYVEEGYSLAIQPDGKILMGGVLNENQNESGPQRFILARYLSVPIPPIPVPIAPICFPAGTPVLTDQGYIEIDKIEPSSNTINGRPIIAVTKTISPSNKLVCFEKSSLGYNIPNRTTYVSTEHCIVYKNKLIEAHKFVNRKRRVYYIKYNGKYLYNILMNRHYSMIVNNIKVETLNPKNIIAKLYTNGYNADYKIELINRINKYYLRNAEQRVIKEGMYKNMMLNYTRAKNQRYRIHRYNQLMNYKAFFTRKRAHNIPSFPVPNVASVASVTNVANVANVASVASVASVTNVASVASVAQKESLKPVPQPPIEYKPSNPIIAKSKIKIDTIGKNKVTLKKIIGTNNKIRIFSYKYTGSKINK